MAHIAASAPTCAVCGESLNGKEACIACLLRAGLDERDDADGADARHIFGDFEIERRDDGSLVELGRGAMGATYRAVDKVLHRKVALKLIEPPAGANDGQAVRERFIREARAAAALRHPNVAGVFHFSASPEIGRCYCAMELVEGETLEARVRRDGPIGVALAIAIGIQVSRALVAAAERGLIHRDLKPGNIMLARGDDASRPEVKVIDFGLAKAATSASDMELTHGGFVGTPAFASPEQFVGATVDARSDIYALGVTLWFALTGRLPSAGNTIEEIRQRQAQHRLPIEQLQSRAVPRPLVNLLRACLEIDPAQRPASARELLRAFEECRARIARKKRQRVTAVLAAAAVVLVAGGLALRQSRPGAPAAAPAERPIEKGLAVLPFENLSTNAEDAFLAEGIQDDVLTSVGKIKELKVIARSSVESFRERHGSGKVRELGESLGVSHVLEGSVRRTGERLVLNVALIDTREERQVWAERYDRSLAETASLHGELAREVGRALQATLTPLETAAASARPTENPEAYLLYLKARESEIQRGEPEPALQLYAQAIALDPNFALARARFSKALTTLNYLRDRTDVEARARVEAEEALRLQPHLGEARVALAHWYLYQIRDLDRASEELRHAAALLPNSAEVQLTAAFLYKRQHRFRDRVAALRRAEALDPRNASVSSFMILTARWIRDWPEAVHASLRRAVFTKGPGYLTGPWSRAYDEFQLSGDIALLKRALLEEEQANPPVPPERLDYLRFETASLERDFARAEHFLNRIPPEAFVNDTEQPTSLFVTAGHNKEFCQALLAVAAARDGEVVSRALARAQEVTEASIKALPTYAFAAKLSADLGLLHAFGGAKDEALHHAQRAVELVAPGPTIERHDMQGALALVYAQTGEPDKALDLIEHLLTVPIELQDGTVYNMTLTDLKWRWVWDPLRSHPRFQKLLAGPEPKTVY